MYFFTFENIVNTLFYYRHANVLYCLKNTSLVQAAILWNPPFFRNPSLKQQLFSYAILGFALSEAMGLFCLMMAFLLLFAF